MFCHSRVETQPGFETKGAGVLKLGPAAVPALPREQVGAQAICRILESEARPFLGNSLGTNMNL